VIKKYFSKTLLLISLILFFYVFYRSEIYWESDKRDYYLIYYYVTIFLIIFSILSFNFKFLNNEYFIITFISFIFFIYSSEVYFNFFYKKILLSYKSKILYENTGSKYDKRSKLEIYKDLSKDNDNITVSVSPFNLIIKNDETFLALAGVSNRKTIFCNENGIYSVYESDRYGFNNPDQEWDKKKIDYLVIGDSFAHGACVNRPYDLASNLRKLANKNVLNLGYSGTSSLSQLAILKEYYKKNTKNIVWFFFENDLEELSYELKNPILLNYKNNVNFTQKLKSKQKMIDKLNSDMLILNNNVSAKLISIIKLKIIRSIINDLILKKEVNLESIRNFKIILKQVKNFSEENNSKLHFVYLEGFHKDIILKNLVKKTINEIGVNFIDINEEIANKGLDFKSFFPFGLPGHYNQYGYNVIAEIVNDNIKN